MGAWRQGRLIATIALAAILGPQLALAQGAAKSAAVEEEAETRQKVAGSIDFIDVDPRATKVEPGDPKLLRVEAGAVPGQIKVYPLKAGVTNLIVSDARGRRLKEYKYSITATDISLKVEQMQQLLDGVEGIQVNAVGDKIILDGELIVPRDLDRILNVVDAFGGAKGGIFNLIQLSKVSQKVIAKRIEDEIRKLPSAQNVTVRLANDTFFLDGVVDSSADRQRAEDVAKTYVPEVLSSRSIQDGVLREVKKQAIRNLIIVNEPPPPPNPKLVRLTFHFVEISKEYLKNVFFKWAPTLSQAAGFQIGESTTGGVGARSGGSFSGTISSLIPRLQKGTNGGYARVLFSSVAIGLEGTNISLNRVDQVPFIQQNELTGVPVTGSKDVGIQISATPSIQGNDTVMLSGTEFSFDALAGAGPGGGLRTTKTQLINTITVRSGDSAVLGGLISNNMAIEVDKDPIGQPEGGGDPIFTLLRSRQFRNSKTQFLVFVTPQIIEDAAEGTADIKKKVIGNKTRNKRFYQ